jgi:hypothetical protein
MTTKNEQDFKLPIDVSIYISNFIPFKKNQTILCPMLDKGNLLNTISGKGNIITPPDFFSYTHMSKYDWVIMKPTSPMKTCYDVLDSCMLLSDNIIALVPWLTMINGDKRTAKIMKFGLKSITHLPRNTFAGSRTQTCILELEKGYKGQTIFKYLK